MTIEGKTWLFVCDKSHADVIYSSFPFASRTRITDFFILEVRIPTFFKMNVSQYGINLL